MWKPKKKKSTKVTLRYVMEHATDGNRTRPCNITGGFSLLYRKRREKVASGDG